MASVIQPPPPPPPIVTTPRLEEHLVDEQIRRTRRSLKWVDFGSGLLTLVIGVLVFLLSMSVLEHWVIPGGWNGPTRIALFSIMLLGIAWYAWRTFWPLISRPINPAYAAQLIERSSPSLKNSLLNFLLLRNRRQQLSQKVYQAIEQQAAQRLSEVSLDSVIDRSAMLRLGYVLVAVVAICALYRVLSPKNLTASMERVLLPWSDTAVPSRVEILNVTPGDAQIARGEHLEVTAEVLGLRTDEPVRVRYSTLDGQSVDREVTLNGSEGSSRFQGRLPDRFSVGGGSDNGGVQQDFEYWIEAGDAKSPKYRVTVFARPTLVVEKIRYQFPAYTGLLPRDVEGTGDVNALEGTKVSLYALANHEIATASVDFGADGRNDLPMSAEKEKATAQFTLALQEDRRTPEHDSYVLQYKTKSGRISSLPPKYSIDVTPDYAPEVRILAPVDDEGKLVEQLDVAVDSPFTVEVEARDPDFALKNVVLLGDVAGEQVLKHDLLTQEQSGKFVGQFTATPAELKLKPGDILEYSAAAIDNREPEPNIAQTEKLRIRVLGPPEFGEQQGQGQGETPQGGQGGESEQGGQGENGEQGQAGGGGTEGESGEQEGEAGSAAGEQGGEGQSQGEQQGQGAQGGNQGEGQQDGEPASAGGSGNQQGEQQNGEQQGEAASAGGGEQDEQQQGDPSGQGGQQSSEGQPGEQSKVSADGSNDGEAFERMSEHFTEKGGQPQEQQEKGQQGQESQGESEQSSSEGETQSNEGAGQGSKSEEPTEGESGKNQDQGIDGAQESEQSEGSGAEGQPSDQQGEAASAGGEKGEQQGEKQEAPGGKMSTEQGEQGAGNNPGENEGSADTDAGRKPSDKQDNGPDSEMNDEEASGQANSQKESDSQGSAGGDQSGGGQEGAGQQADSQGTGTAGENTAADDGAGQSQESGAGENSSQAGQQGQSDKPTGESSENQTGEGSKQSEQPGGEGAAASGDQSQSNPGENGEPGEGAAASGKDGQQPGEPASAGGEKSEQPPQGSQPSGNPGQGPPSGGTGNNNATPPPAGELAPGDEANLDYTRKQTDLVLDRLDEQLKKNEVDEALLDKLGWSKEELQRFVDRWKSLKAEATATPGEETQSELDSALRSLGLNPNRRTGFKAQVTKEKLRQLQDSYRGQTPLEYADQVRAYIKGTAAAPEEKAD